MENKSDEKPDKELSRTTFEQAEKKPDEPEKKDEQGLEKKLGEETGERKERKETEQKIEKTREKLDKLYMEKERSVSGEKKEEGEKLTPEELFAKAEKENVGNSIDSKITEFLKDNPISENFLKERSENIIQAIAGILQEVENHLKNLKEEAYMADMGSGRGQITEAMLNRFGENIRAICIDSKVGLSREVKKRNKTAARNRIAEIRGDAKKTELEDGSVDFVTASYFLQDLGTEEKLEAVKEMERIVKDEGYILIIDELLKEDSGNLENAIKHYLLNLFNPGKYEIFNDEKWSKNVFDKISGEVVKKVNFGRNSFAVLMKIKKMRESEQA